MTKITVRYFIDGAQVYEAEAELPDRAKARELIEQSKRDLSESVSSIVRAVPALGSDTVRVLRLERKLRERMGKED
jgi:hypothetical protein